MKQSRKDRVMAVLKTIAGGAALAIAVLFSNVGAVQAADVASPAEHVDGGLGVGDTTRPLALPSPSARDSSKSVPEPEAGSPDSACRGRKQTWSANHTDDFVTWGSHACGQDGASNHCRDRCARAYPKKFEGLWQCKVATITTNSSTGKSRRLAEMDGYREQCNCCVSK